jgi:putative protein-disulfide isomerase
MNATLHYIYDPLCGWCYGAEPLVRAAERVEGLGIALHGGGLWPEPTRLSEPLRNHIRHADERIATMSGQPFGAPYLSGLLQDPSLVLDSRPPIAAILAAQTLDPPKALPMLRSIQHAHYERGQHVVDEAVLLDLAAHCGLDPDAFGAALAEAPVDAHIETSRRLMGRVGSRGFPTFLLQIGEQWYAVPHERFAAEPEEFGAWLAEAVARAD